MSEHLSRTQIVNYGRGPLAAGEWLNISDHLAVCEMCRLQVEEEVGTEASYLALKSLVFDGADVGHLSFEQLAEYVEESTGRGEGLEVREHLAWCEECERAVEDLREFKEQVAREQEGERSALVVGRESRWERMVAGLAWLRPKSPALVMGTGLAILTLAVGWVGWQGLTGMKIRPEVAGVSPSVAPVSEPEIIARLNDGEGQIKLDEKGKLSGVDQLPAAYERMIKKALTEQRIEKTIFQAEGAEPGYRSRGESGVAGGLRFSVIEPVGEVIQTDRPRFRWTQLEGARGYVVEVYDEGFNQLLSSPQITGNSWQVPRSLKRDGSYYWQVKAIKEGQEYKAPRPPAPQAEFRILDQATAEEVEKARRSYASSHLMLGLLYARAGMLDEAEVEFKALLKNNPDSALAQRLLRQVRTKP